MTRTDPLIIDLGCGSKKMPGALGIDQFQLPGVDLVWNMLDFPYPIRSESVDQVICFHVIEHFDPDDALRIIGEIYRILKPGGVFRMTSPHGFSIAGYIDPTHKSFWTFRTFDYFSREHPYSYYITRHFNFRPARMRGYVELWPLSWQRSRAQALSSIWASRLFNLSHFISPVLPDLLVKMLPIFRLDVTVWLEKQPLG